MKEIINQLLDMAPVIWKVNEANGYWKDKEKRNQGEAVALIITELAEAIEGYRKQKWYPLNSGTDSRYESFDKFKEDYLPVQKQMGSLSDDDTLYKIWYESHVKDSVQAEMAGTVIRLLDCIHGFNWSSVTQYTRRFGYETDNIPDGIRHLMYLILETYRIQVLKNPYHVGMGYPAPGFGDCLQEIVAFCQDHHIDIVKHVQLEVEYNRVRKVSTEGKIC